MNARTQIVIATSSDLRFIVDLQRKFSDQLGFIPREGLEVYLAAGQVSLALENDEPAGFILGRPSLRWKRSMRPLTQAAIHFDAQRRHHGLALVATAEAAARDAHQCALQAMCREGLDANEFWRAAGFIEIGKLDPQSTRRRQIVCWRKPLITAVPNWFHQLPPLAGYRSRRTRAKSYPSS